jgi:hypothetical protein
MPALAGSGGEVNSNGDIVTPEIMEMGIVFG